MTDTHARTPRKIAFVLAASDQATMIVNRFDFRRVDDRTAYGVSHDILEFGAFDPDEVTLGTMILQLRREIAGDGVVALDCGANIGVHTVAWAKAMTGWGSVLAVEAQERLFYALGGNIVLNNCFNARAVFGAVTDRDGALSVPTPDYCAPGSFGSLELMSGGSTEFIGQPIDYSEAASSSVPAFRIDGLASSRVDFIKMDVEGMELLALAGARRVMSSFRPIVLIEHIKCGEAPLRTLLESYDYRVGVSGKNLIGVHAADPCASRIRLA